MEPGAGAGEEEVLLVVEEDADWLIVVVLVGVGRSNSAIQRVAGIWRRGDEEDTDWDEGFGCAPLEDEIVALEENTWKEEIEYWLAFEEITVDDRVEEC